MSIKVFGIKNCDTMKKTFQLLEKEGIAYQFIDYKKEKPSRDLLKDFLVQTDLAALINKRGTTFRNLPSDQKALLENQDTALAVLTENSSIIKRPIVQFTDGQIVVGLFEEKILDIVRSK